MPYDFSSVSVLLVEDNAWMRLLVRDLLNGFGLKTVHHASDGASAMQALAARDPDIVICDWHMAPIDGLAFTRQVRRARDTPNPYVPIVMLTGHTERHRVAEARDAGVTEFLAKPVTARALYGRLVAIVERPRQFVFADSFVGPDRRRRSTPNYGGEERRGAYEAFEI